jgi:4-amino-4-deoxy-L-arabinose transferase-like glycosyltransferase
MMPMNLPTTVAEQDAKMAALQDRPRAARVVKVLEALLLLVAAIFFSLHFVHLRADFPNHSPWMDWAKYTDEGWYGDAAIRHYQLGHWNVAGDFNAAAALPVWPALELVLFRVTGVSLSAARALTVVVFGLTMVCCYGVIRRWPIWPSEKGGAAGRCTVAGELRFGRLAAAIAVLLLAVSPFCYAFSRLAILEPLLVLLALAALLVASTAGAAGALAWSEDRQATKGRVKLRFAAWSVALGLLLPMMILTKTTGIFLFPAIFWLLWASGGYRVKPFLGVSVLAGGVGVSLWGAYYGLIVRPRYRVDYRYLFSANTYTGITRSTFWQVLNDTLFDTTWIGKTLFWVALAAVVGSLASLFVPRLRGNPLIVALLIWVFGYGAFLAYHDNLQPRYYLVLAIPLTLLATIGFSAVLTGAFGEVFSSWIGRWLLRLIVVAGGSALAFAVCSGAVQTVGYVLHPEYTWVSAAGQVRDVVDREFAAHPAHSRLVLSISGSDLALMTGLPAICDDFGTMTLPDRVAAYQPGWFATWNNVEDDKMDALSPMFRLVRVAAFPVFDDPERNLFILYRLDRVSSPGRPGRPGRRRSLSVQKRLRTKVGEQPSALQLEH